MSEWWQQPQENEPPAPTEGASDPTPSEPEPAPTEGASDPAPSEPEPTPSESGWQSAPRYVPTGAPTYQWNPQRPTFTPSQPPQPPQKPKKNGVLVALVAILGVLCVLSLGVTTVLLVNRGQLSPTPQEGTTTTTTREENPNAPTMDIQDNGDDDGGITTAEIAEKCLDSTVVITVYDVTSSHSYGGFIIGSDGEQQTGSASGIVWREDGYIITNQHVCIDASTGKVHDRIEVQLYNGAVYDATLVGADADTDLAVVKIAATGLKAAEFGDSSAARLGDRVVTIGNSGGLPWSVSQGVLSGKDRDVYDQTGYEIRCLQVDANINPGSSGGPLLNKNGKVIGINSAKIVYTGYEDLGFSIPITEAKPVLEDLVRYGYARGRIALGITGYNISTEDYEGGGFMIDTIAEGSSLTGTPLQRYDIITHIDGKRVANRTELRAELSKYKAGDTIQITAARIVNSRTGETREVTASVVLQESKE